MKTTKSSEYFNQAKKYIPGGVNSPVRAFGNVGMDPIVIDHAQGDKLYDVDGNEYIDYICSWGPMVFGHDQVEKMDQIVDSIKHGLTFGLTTKVEGDMAQFMVETYPSIDMVRMVNSGTEATMSALRLARGYTNRDKIVKFEGCYHGHSDSLLVKSGSGTLTFGNPTSLGVPSKVVEDTLVSRFNDVDMIEKIFQDHGDEIACVIVEPVAANMGLIPASQDFLQALRDLTKQYGALLIFDEVITGYRVALAGASEVYGIQPDLACFGKIIGGGMPVGAYGGKREIMELVSPLGGVYQAGTLSGNPLAMALGLSNLKKLQAHPEVYDLLEDHAKKLEAGFKANIEKYKIKATVNRFKGLLSLFFTEGPVTSYDQVASCDVEAYAEYFRYMLEAGVMFGPSQYECIFVSSALTEDSIDHTIQAQAEAFAKMVE